MSKAILNGLYRRKGSGPTAPDYRVVEIHSRPSDAHFNHVWIEVVYLDGLIGGSFRVHVADFALLYEAKEAKEAKGTGQTL